MGTRQTQHMLGQIGQDQVGQYQFDLVETYLAGFAFDVEFLSQAKATVDLDARISRLKLSSAANILVILASAQVFWQGLVRATPLEAVLWTN